VSILSQVSTASNRSSTTNVPTRRGAQNVIVTAGGGGIDGGGEAPAAAPSHINVATATAPAAATKSEVVVGAEVVNEETISSSVSAASEIVNSDSPSPSSLLQTPSSSSSSSSPSLSPSPSLSSLPELQTVEEQPPHSPTQPEPIGQAFVGEVPVSRRHVSSSDQERVKTGVGLRMLYNWLNSGQDNEALGEYLDDTLIAYTGADNWGRNKFIKYCLSDRSLEQKYSWLVDLIKSKYPLLDDDMCKGAELKRKYTAVFGEAVVEVSEAVAES